MTTSRIDTLMRLLAQDPADGTSHYMLGHEYFKAQKFAEAVAALQRYLQLAEDEGAAYRMLAQSLERLGKIDEARQAYRNGLAAATRLGYQPLIDEYAEALRGME